MWTRTDVATWAAKTSVRMMSASLLSFATGATLSYFGSKKFLQTKYETLAKKEIEEAKKFYGRLNKTSDDTLTPEQVLESLHGEEAVTLLRNYQGGINSQAEEVETGTPSAPEPPDEVLPPQTKNIFMEAEHERGGWDYAIELRIREENPDKPYIIHVDEFEEGEASHERAVLTYFEEDDVLVDDQELPTIPDVDGTVGEDNLSQFGHGSNDKNTLYVRNERLGLDFEITRHEGSYTKSVLGDIEHSDEPRLRKFRRHDE